MVIFLFYAGLVKKLVCVGTVRPAKPYQHNIVTNCWEKELLNTSPVTETVPTEEVSNKGEFESSNFILLYVTNTSR